MAGKSETDLAALFKAMPLAEQSPLLAELTAIHNGAKEAKRAELMAELQALGGGPVAKPTRTRAPKEVQEGDARLVVKSVYRGPNGEEWSSRGAMPKWAKALGITDKAGLEPYRIKE